MRRVQPVLLALAAAAIAFAVALHFEDALIRPLRLDRGGPRPLPGRSSATCYLWLQDGPHRLVIHKAGYRSFDEDVSVLPGQEVDLKVRLENGDPQVPGTRPGANATQAH